MNQEYSELLIDFHAPEIVLSELVSADWIAKAKSSFTNDCGKWKCAVELDCKLTGKTYTGQGTAFQRDDSCAQATLAAISNRFDCGHYGSLTDDQDTIGQRVDLVYDCSTVEQALSQIESSRPVADIVLRPMLLSAVQH